MKITVRGNSSSGTSAEGTITTSASNAVLVLDSRQLYQVAESDWTKFCDVMLSGTFPPPALPASNWEVGRTDASYLRSGERFQLLFALVHIASQIPAGALFSGAAFDPAQTGSTFYDKQMRDGHGNLLYPPDAGVQQNLAQDQAARQQMTGPGYLCTCEIEDDAGTKSEFVFRPYNTGFAESRRWSGELQRLRAQIEDRRHR